MTNELTSAERFRRYSKATQAVADKHEQILSKCFDFSPPIGWLPVVDKLLTDISQFDESVRVVQVKAKFGGLRCYTEGAESEEVHDLIRKAEEDCSSMCQDCGKPSVQGDKGWISVLCEEHRGQ